MRRSSWLAQGGDAVAVAAVVASGGDEPARVGACEGDRGGENVRGREGEVQGVLGVQSSSRAPHEGAGDVDSAKQELALGAGCQ